MIRTKLTPEKLIAFRVAMRILCFETELAHVRLVCGMPYALCVTHAIRRKDKN